MTILSKLIYNVSEISTKEIEHFINLTPVSITNHPVLDKNIGMNDYYSQADYWWPTENNKNYYIRKDGMSNPEIFSKHRETLKTLRRKISILSLISCGDNQPATRSLEEQLFIFFCNPATKMNPNLLHSQAILGRCTGRSAGIIDGLPFAEVAIALRFIENFQNLEILNGTLDWFSEYFVFLTESDWGKLEAKRENNHATAYWLQISSIALLLGYKTWIDKTKIWLENNLYKEQMSDQGFFAAEISRTKPLCYSIFQVNCLSLIHQVISLSNLYNSWDIRYNDRSLIKALEWVRKYVYKPEIWPFQNDIQYFECWKLKHPFLFIHSKITKNKKASAELKKLSLNLNIAEVERNMPAICLPLWSFDDLI